MKYALRTYKSCCITIGLPHAHVMLLYMSIRNDNPLVLSTRNAYYEADGQRSKVKVVLAIAALIPAGLGHWKLVCSSVTPSDVMEQLPLNIAQQTTSTKAEEVGFHPLISQLFLHERKPGAGVFSRTDATSRLESHLFQQTH